jgi:hypothetical protein
MSGIPVPAAHAQVTSDAAVKDAPGALVAVLLTAGAGAAADITLYDNASAASGTKLVVLKALTGESEGWAPATPYVASKGIYADINGSGAEATVVYL